MINNKEEAEYIFKHLAYKTKSYDELGKEFGVHKTTLCKQMAKFKKEFELKDNEKYCATTYLRYKYKDEIIQKYKEGISTKQIAQDYGFSDDNMIANILRSLDIQVRGVGYQSRTNQTLFETINDEISAYTLGLITSDGNIGKNYTISISLKQSDKKLLEQINEKMFNNTGLLLDVTSHDNCFRLSINGKQICKNLEKYGLAPNKSYLLTEICYFKEPLMQHYLRGLYDGDGVCVDNKPYLRVGYCNYNESFTKSYQQYLVNTLNLNENKLFNTGNCWHCSWGNRQDLEKFYNYLYKDATIFLSRKHDKLYNYLYGNTEVSG